MYEEPKLAWKADGISLAWITVKNLETAIKYYTQVVGLTLNEHNPEYKWAELSGPNGAALGIAEENPEMAEAKAGTNAIVAINVDDIDAARKTFVENGATLIGEIMEVPGHVKLQTFADEDGNVMQLAEILSK